jgi:hypothetical protein
VLHTPYFDGIADIADVVDGRLAAAPKSAQASLENRTYQATQRAQPAPIAACRSREAKVHARRRAAPR